MSRRFLVSLLLALLLHGVVVLWYPHRPVREVHDVAQPTSGALDVVLQQPSQQTPPLEPPEPLLDTPGPPRPVEAAPEPPDPNQPEPIAPEVDRPIAKTREIRPHSEPGLDLSRPDDWHAALLVAPDADRGDVFTAFLAPDKRAALATARRQQRARGRLNTRLAQTGGLSVDAYNGLEVAGSNHMKTEKGCFSLLSGEQGEMIQMAGVARQWYRTACKGVLANPLLLPEFETDALGRALSDP